MERKRVATLSFQVKIRGIIKLVHLGRIEEK